MDEAMTRFLGFLLSCALHLLLLAVAIWMFEVAPPSGGGRPPELLELTLAPSAEAPDQGIAAGGTAGNEPGSKILGVVGRMRLPTESCVREKLISPHKTDAPLGEDKKMQQELGESIFFGSGYLKQGNEVRLSLRALRAVEFTRDDFLGSYKVQGEERMLEVRKLEDGRLLFIDHETNMRRLLRKKGKFIYTYGPGYDVQEPVCGSLTFLPHERKALDLPSRLMWLPEEPPMRMGVMQGWPELSP